jgi:hypothetical protein
VNVPPIKLSHRLRKTENNAIELAKCIAIVISKYALFSSLINSLKDPPIQAGINIAWPKLDTGKSSVIPCINPVIIA